MTETDIIQVTSSGEAIHELVQQIEPVLVGHTKAEAITAMLSMIIELQHPHISPEDKSLGVKEISAFICLWVGEKDGLDSMNMNGRMN